MPLHGYRLCEFHTSSWSLVQFIFDRSNSCPFICFVFRKDWWEKNGDEARMPDVEYVQVMGKCHLAKFGRPFSHIETQQINLVLATSWSSCSLPWFFITPTYLLLPHRQTKPLSHPKFKRIEYPKYEQHRNSALHVQVSPCHAIVTPCGSCTAGLLNNEFLCDSQGLTLGPGLREGFWSWKSLY